MKHIKANPKVHEEYQRLSDISSITNALTITHESNKDDDVLTVSLLNIRFLRKHCIDIKYDINIVNSDIIAFTETQLLPSDTDHGITTNLHEFTQILKSGNMYKTAFKNCRKSILSHN